MAWTYNNPNNSPKDQVRLLIQDTTLSRALFQDEEIEWFLTQEMNVYMVAARCCNTVVVRFGAVKSRKVGDLSIDYDPDFYRGLAAEYRARGQSYQTPYVGGISVADKLAQEADPDWIQPRAFRGEFDNPGANQPAPGNVNDPTNYGPGY